MKELDDLLGGVYSPTITDVSVLVREIRARIGVLTTPVTIRIYYDGRKSEPYRFELSAVMKTSAKSEACRPAGSALTEGDALRNAVRLLTQSYEDAVRQGNLPDDSWLCPPGRKIA